MPSDRTQLASVRASFILICGNHQTAGVRDLATHFFQALISRLENGAHPFSLGIQGSSPRLFHEVLRERFPKARGVDISRVCSPRHLSRVGHEEHWTHNEVAQSIAVPVGEVGFRALDPLFVFFVANEWDSGGVGAERSAGEGKAARGLVKSIANTIAPRQGVSCMVNLVEDDQSAVQARARGMNHGIRRNLRVGDRHTVKVRARHSLRVRKCGVDVDSYATRCLGPLALEVFGRANDRHFLNYSGAHQLDRYAQSEGRFTGSGRCNGKEIFRRGSHVLFQGCSLPRSKATRGPPGGSARKSGRKRSDCGRRSVQRALRGGSHCALLP